ncbi:MAG: 50S ribosomal protein L4 [Candidatus Omnitrophota bacterium]
MKTNEKKTKTKNQNKTAKAPEAGKPLSIPVYDSKGKEVEKYALDKDLFTGEINKGALYQMVLMYNANQRSGTASTKTRGDVSGGGKKPWRQKGTGRARAGSSRSPLWKGGGKIFGPHPRDFHYDIPKKVKRVAFLSSLNVKAVEHKMFGLSSLDLDEAKTKKFKAIMDALKLKGKSLFVLESVDDKVKKASRNIGTVSVKNYKDFNAVDVIACDTVVLSKAALGKLKERFGD